MSFVAKLVEYHTIPPAAAHQDAEQVRLPMADAHGQAESWTQIEMSPDSKSTHPSTAARGVDSNQPPKTATRASIPKAILRMLHASTLSPRENRDKVVASKENSTRQRCHAPNKATRLSIPKRRGRSTRPKQREGRQVVNSKQNSQDAPHTSAPTR